MMKYITITAQTTIQLSIDYIKTSKDQKKYEKSDMLQSMLIGFIPAIVGLTAAFYILHKIYARQEEDGYRNGPQSIPTFPTGRTSTPGSEFRQRGVDRGAGDRISKCAICFEESRIVEIYPCGHRDLCEACATKIISMSNKLCPFCRRTIKGYRLLG